MGYPNAGKIDIVAKRVRALAVDLPPEDRAKLIREVLFQVREAVKRDLPSQLCPNGKQWELERLNDLYARAERHWMSTLERQEGHGSEA